MKNLVLSLNFNLGYNKEAEFYYRDSGCCKDARSEAMKEGGKDGSQLCSPTVPMCMPEKGAAGSAPVFRTLPGHSLGIFNDTDPNRSAVLREGNSQ